MSVHQEIPTFTLPGGERIYIRQLTANDARPTEVVIENAWDATYVEAGLIDTATRKTVANSEDDKIVDWLGQRILEARDGLLRGEPRGVLYLGAFAVTRTDTGKEAKQIGMLKYSAIDPPDKTMAKTMKIDGLFEGMVDEVDVLPEWAGHGVGRALFFVALSHALEARHMNFNLDVVELNGRARGFYTRRLGMAIFGAGEPMPHLPGSMKTLRMRGLVRTTLKSLLGNNPWLAPTS